jgi:hypothetical protein
MHNIIIRHCWGSEYNLLLTSMFAHPRQPVSNDVFVWIPDLKCLSISVVWALKVEADGVRVVAARGTGASKARARGRENRGGWMDWVTAKVHLSRSAGRRRGRSGRVGRAKRWSRRRGGQAGVAGGSLQRTEGSNVASASTASRSGCT